MYRTLSDLRIVQLAQHLEDVFEAYGEGLRDSIPEVPVRARLAPLFKPSPGHSLLKLELARLSEQVRRMEGQFNSADLLQALRDCELVAHDFYVHELDHVSDPAIVALFKRLAAEELQHAHIVEEAVAALKGLPRHVKPATASAHEDSA